MSTAFLTMPPTLPSHSIRCSSSSLSFQPNTAKPQPFILPKSTSLSLQFREKILCLETLGVDSGKVLSRNPSLCTSSLQSLHSIISFLRSKGIHHKDMPRIFGMCPRILTSDVEADIDPVFHFLSNELWVPENQFRRVINKCPRLLSVGVDAQLKPALDYLKRIGFRNLKALAYQDPILLVSSVERTLIPKLKYLESIGFQGKDAVGMVLRCPGLFTFSIENNFEPKFGYFEMEMKGRRLDELRGFPQYFAFSLEKRIKPRHRKVVWSGVEMGLPVMLKSTDDEFHNLIRQGRV
ncbi:transcription termination factor MTEF1, chloroplastic-like [Punica granatum]|uniref:Uncharacterized protein n=2 Tax=Punica granatum TaxID=22663 RepID=A0A218VUU6_PUNGR|nr:transcription termination factor MTEF1, chloroplastic-like [Punica granatum]OWM63850.1 hypothetical protein CDL15_Pgr006112 [Punica granatum]PKI68063.1 hypothetical protein CRG98_011659 [Punica granatum]